MKIETRFAPGDKIWVTHLGRNSCSLELTVGRVQATVTDSPGRGDEEMFDNYKKQSSYEENYMCVETGIGSGSVYTLGVHAFATKEEADSAITYQLRQIENQI